MPATTPISLKSTIAQKNPCLDASIVRTMEPTEVRINLAGKNITMQVVVEHTNAQGEKVRYIGDQIHAPSANNERKVVVTNAQLMQYRDALPTDPENTQIGEYDLIMGSPVGLGLMQLVNTFVAKVIANGYIDSGVVRG